MTSLTTTPGGLPKALFLTRQEVESKAIMAHLEDVKALEHGQYATHYQGIFASDEQQWRVGVAEISGEGSFAAKEVDRAVNEFRPQCILFVGVGQGCQGVEVGDVAVASKLYGSSGLRRQDSVNRLNECRSSDMMLQRVREEADGLAWLRHIDEALTDDTPKVVIAPIAAGHEALFSPDTLKLPLLPRPKDGTCAVTSENVNYFAPTFSKHSKVILIQGVGSMIGDEDSEHHDQERAMLYASAFAFQVLSQVVPLSTSATQIVSPISSRYTFLAALGALAFGILSSLPLFCVRQKPYVKELGVQHWMVWLRVARRTIPRTRYWVVRTDRKKKQPLAFLLLSTQSSEGFYQATPLYWDTRISLKNRANWVLEPWKSQEPPAALRDHPWILLQRREDGSLALHNLFILKKSKGRALVYLKYKRKRVVGEIRFSVGPPIVIQRKFWDWKILQEGQGFLPLRLVPDTVVSPKSLTKHEWPPVLTLQQERDQNRVLWRFLDKVPEVQLPGSKWIILRPGNEPSKPEALGLVQVEPGDEGWVKVLRMPWRDIESYKNISVKYYDTRNAKSVAPDWSRFGEISRFCSNKSITTTFGSCVQTNLGRNDKAQAEQWYWVQGESLYIQNKQTHRLRGFVRLSSLRSHDSYAQAFLLPNRKLRWRRLVKLSPKERQTRALKLCHNTLPDLRNLLRLPMQRLTRKMWERRYQSFEEQLLVAALLAGRRGAPVRDSKQARSPLGRCMREGERLQLGIRKKLMLSDWSQRWRDAQSMMLKQPDQALLLLRGLCHKSPSPRSEALCNKALLRIHLTTKVRDFTDVSDAWAKRLRLLLRQDPCFTVRMFPLDKKSEWVEVEEQLRTQDLLPYRPVYCRGLRARSRTPRVALVQTLPSNTAQILLDTHLLSQRWTSAIHRLLFRQWNAIGLKDKPRLSIVRARSSWMELGPKRLQKALNRLYQRSKSDVVVLSNIEKDKRALSLLFQVWAFSPDSKGPTKWRKIKSASGTLLLRRWNVFEPQRMKAFKGLFALLNRVQMGHALLPSRPVVGKPRTRPRVRTRIRPRARVRARRRAPAGRRVHKRRSSRRASTRRAILPSRRQPVSRPGHRVFVRRAVPKPPPRSRAVPPRRPGLPTSRPGAKSQSSRRKLNPPTSRPVKPLTFPSFREIRTTFKKRLRPAPTTRPTSRRSK